MKHAYLILAHNDFRLLQRLISAIDYADNDIFVHIDRKVGMMPKLRTLRSRLFMLAKRENVRWGHVSQIRAEFNLIQAALAYGAYEYLHIVSGTHYPLKSPREIHSRFSQFGGRSVFSPILCGEEDIRFKLGLRHYFFGGQNYGPLIKRRLCNILWRVGLNLQRKSAERAATLFRGKACQWLSLSGKDAAVVVGYRKEIQSKFKRTFCGDELFMPYLFERAGLEYVKSDKLLYQDFTKASPTYLKESDFRKTMDSGCCFARKLSSGEERLLDLIDQVIHKKEEN